MDKLLNQIEREYQTAYNAHIPVLEKRLKDLKLYNNDKKDADKVGYPLLFTIQQTLLASLYKDRLDVAFEPREFGDREKAENTTKLAEYDYDLMGMDELTYYWDWDAIFFGRGFLLNHEFKSEKNGYIAPFPELLDPMVVLADPYALSVNGIRGKGGARYIGWVTRATKDELKESGLYKNLDQIEEKSGTPDSLFDMAKMSRNEATGQNLSVDEKEDGGVELLHWFTIFEGKRIFVTLANERKVIIRKEELDIDYYPIVDRVMYPTSHEWYAVGLPALVGSAQRKLAVMGQLAVDMTKANLYPMYEYNPSIIENSADLDVGFNKFIPSKQVGAGIREMQRAQLNVQVFDYIMNMLENSAQKAASTPDMQSGSIEDSKRTASEITLVSSKIDARYSLSASVFGWSEKEFWRQWYNLYKKHFKKLDEKTIRLTGVLGSPNRPITRKDIVAHKDYDVVIESRVVSEAKRAQKVQMLTNLVALASNVPETNVRFALKHMAKLSGLDNDEVDQIFPKTSEEYRAEGENILLSKEPEDDTKEVFVTPEDDHQLHITTHAKAGDTKHRARHVATHLEYLRKVRANPALAPQATMPSTNEAEQPIQGGGLAEMGGADYNNTSLQPMQ